jgi:hypothetical protein
LSCAILFKNIEEGTDSTYFLLGQAAFLVLSQSCMILSFPLGIGVLLPFLSTIIEPIDIGPTHALMLVCMNKGPTHASVGFGARISKRSLLIKIETKHLAWFPCKKITINFSLREVGCKQNTIHFL